MRTVMASSYWVCWVVWMQWGQGSLPVFLQDFSILNQRQLIIIPADDLNQRWASTTTLHGSVDHGGPRTTAALSLCFAHATKESMPIENRSKSLFCGIFPFPFSQWPWLTQNMFCKFFFFYYMLLDVHFIVFLMFLNSKHFIFCLDTGIRSLDLLKSWFQLFLVNMHKSTPIFM